MNVYFIDYENVKVDGLKGVGRLTDEDKVIFFYSEKASRLSFGLHRRIIQSNANFEYRKVDVGSPNALDFQLASCVGYELGKDENKKIEAVIVSKDKGYDNVVNYWTKGGYKISRVDDIASEVQSSKSMKIAEIESLIGDGNKNYSNDIYEALRERKSKSGVHTYLSQKIHDNQKVSELYKLIKPLLADKS